MTESNNVQVQTPPQVPSRRNWGDWLLHRWPTALGIALAFLTLFDGQIDSSFVSSLAAIIVVMALVYLGAAVLARRSAAWWVFLAGFVVIFLLRLLDLSMAAVIVFWISALALLAVSVVRAQWRSTDTLPLQTGGMVAFGAVALVALSVDPVWAGYLLAAALLAHAAWDAVHWWRNRVVPRTYAEFCGVVDLLLGVAILVML